MLTTLLIAIIPKILGMLIGGYYFRYLPVPYRLIMLIMLLGIIVESAGAFIQLRYHVSNAWVFNIYMIIEFSLYCVTGYFFLPAGVSRLALPGALLGWIVWIYQMVRHSIFNFSIVALISGSLIIDVLYLSVFILNAMQATGSLLKNSLFWLSGSVILYYVCDIPQMTVIADTVNTYMHKTINMPSFDINNVLNFVSNAMVVFSFILIGRRKGDVALN